MQKRNGHDRSFDTALLNEQAIVDHMPTTERSNQASSDHLGLSLEMAVEWAHLGGD